MNNLTFQNPFLLANDVVAQPWLMRLVESTGEDLDVLPVQCLCEYLLYDAMTHAQASKTDRSHISRAIGQPVNIDIFDNLCAVKPGTYVFPNFLSFKKTSHDCYFVFPYV